MKKTITLLSLVLILLSAVQSQNIAITDDNAYTANPSAMLDIKSLTKGMLVPRMTSVERTNIVSPATGLLVFDTNVNEFFYYTGSVWTNLSAGQLWTKSGGYVYLSNTDDNVGIGITNPDNKLLVKADATTGIDESIFAVLNNNGDTVFAVYQEGVRIWVDDNGGTKANGSRGGFAVGGYSPTKAGFTNEYLRVTPDSVRIYINDDYVPAKANGSRGGFAVGGYSPAKGAPTDNYLFVQDDSTRVYVADSMEGFGVENIESTANQRIMKLSTENYYIGHEAGLNSLTTAVYNSFIGYQSGMANTVGSNNVFLGYKSGNKNTSGHSNVFIGENAGASNTTGPSGVFIGKSAGMSHTTGYENIFIGEWCGQNTTTGHSNLFMGRLTGSSNITGSDNVYLGKYAGYFNVAGSQNVFVGNDAGMQNDGNGNVFLGYQVGNTMSGSNKLLIDNSDADQNNSLIYGEFDNDLLKLNSTVNVRDMFVIQESIQLLNNGGTIISDKSYIKVEGVGGPVVLDAVVPISPGTYVGQLLILEGNISNVTIMNGGSVSLSNLIVLDINDTLTLIWNGSQWIETSRSIN